MFVENSKVIKKANEIYSVCNTRDPRKVARELGIEVLEYPFQKQKGAYKVIIRNRFIFLKDDLDPVMSDIVLMHEIGHDVLHRKEAIKAGGLKEFNIFAMQDIRMEYEANIFASQLALPDDEFLEYCKRGYDTQQIAMAMNSDINLVALKADILNLQGYDLKPQEHDNVFLRFDN